MFPVKKTSVRADSYHRNGTVIGERTNLLTEHIYNNLQSTEPVYDPQWLFLNQTKAPSEWQNRDECIKAGKKVLSIYWNQIESYDIDTQISGRQISEHIRYKKTGTKRGWQTSAVPKSFSETSERIAKNANGRWIRCEKYRGHRNRIWTDQRHGLEKEKYV